MSSADVAEQTTNPAVMERASKTTLTAPKPTTIPTLLRREQNV